MKRQIVVAVVALLSAGGVFAQDAKDNLQARAKAAIEKSLDWLISNQQTNGVWSKAEFPALTAMPVWALVGVNRESDKEAIRKGCEFLRSCAREDGGIYAVVPGRKGGSLGTYNTAMCMTALYYADKANSLRIIQKAREYVAASQLLGDDEYRGGFGYERDSKRPYADLNNAAWAVSAMRVTQDVEDLRPAGEQKVDIDWKAAAEYIDKMQVTKGDKDAATEDEGGFLYKRPSQPEGSATQATGGKNPDTNGTAPERPVLRSYGSITYSGILAMIYARVGRDDPRVVSAIDYARRYWTVDENPGMGQQGLFYYYTIMARTLSLLDIDSLPALKDGVMPIAWRDDLVNKIIALQREDGSWCNPNNRFWESDPVLATSYGVLALEYALRMFK